MNGMQLFCKPSSQYLILFEQVTNGAIYHSRDWPKNKSEHVKWQNNNIGAQNVFIQNVAKCLGVIFRVHSSSQSAQMKHIHFNY